jgi:hypothetical protein
MCNPQRSLVEWKMPAPFFYYEESAEESRPMEDLLAHEIAHPWFGDMASEKSLSTFMVE